ncbi:MAG: sigma-70 family RNA polymerase sigma factor, partial [Candidatus Omnitrophota bacterium]
PSDEEIAKKLKLSREKMEEIVFWMTTTTSSLEAPVGDEEDSQVSDLLEDRSAVSPDAGIEKLLDKERLDNLLELMSEREREVLDLRFGLAESKPHTLAELSKKMGVSRERVRQIEEAALKRLRKFVKKQEQELRERKGKRR